MRYNHAKSNLRVPFFCTFLSYLLLLSLVPPFAPPAVSAATQTSEAKPGADATPAAQGSAAASREGELIVRFRANVSEEEKNALVGGRGARRAKKLRGDSRLEKLTLGAGQNPAEVAADLSRQPGVELAEPNFVIRRTQTTPDDVRFGEQWALRNNGQTGGQTGADLGALDAWQSVTGTTSTVIAVIDSGIDFSHPDLENNRWTNNSERANRRDDDRNGFADDLNGWDWVEDGNVVRDEQGHGTAIAGVIAAQGNNGVGTAGVMWRASLMSLRVLDRVGVGNVADAVEAIDYAAANGAQVINCSWGTEGESLALRDAIERAGQRGVLVVTSAGNGGRDVEAAPYYPASFDLPNLVAVASTDQFDNLASWSNWGETRVAVAAPGTDVLTTKMGGDYWTVSGTSASAPLVAGVAGLVLSAHPWLDPASVRRAIVDGARRVDALAGRVASGGVANAAGALGAAARNPYEPGDGGGGGKDKDKKEKRQTPRPEPPGHGGRDENEFKKEAREPEAKAAENLPDLDDIRNEPSHVPESPQPSIRSNLAPICDTCYEDPGGGGAIGGDSEYSNSRDEPQNDTGEPGVDLGSRNFNWSTPLVRLPGRAGLDLDLTLYYNSLVWTKQGGGIQFNADNGYPGPGFQLGFPTVQEQFYDGESGTWAYMMVSPTGDRVKLVYVGNNGAGQGVYEANDSSYTQLTDYGAGGALVRTTDGTSFTFANIASGEKRCTQIKDRNGNYITITYTGAGRVSQVTDTLGRVVNFNYDGDGNLASLTQARSAHGLTDTLATFSYGSLYMQPSFSGLAVYGPNNTYVSVLTRVSYPNGSRHDFEYNPFGQIHTIRHYAPDGHQLSYIGYNLPGSYWQGMSAQTDCPRVIDRRDWVEYGVMNASQEVVTTYAAAADGSWSQVTLPDGTVQKEFFATSGWQKGLTTLTEVWSGGVRRKWTTLSWTQDNTGLAYQKNPRVTEVNIYDEAGNRRRTTIEYNQGYSLPTHVREWGGTNGQTYLRMQATSYQLDPAYTSRRIIGLVFRSEIYDPAGLQSKTEFYHDWSGSDMFQDTPAPATQHDRTNYGPSFVHGRGNLSLIARYNINDPNNAGGTATETKFRYNSTGSLLMERDHLWHPTYFEYGDSFSDGANRNTFAYVTRITDADGYQSTTQYNYATGMVTRTSKPSSGTGAGVTYLTQTRAYDAVGRLDRITTVNNGAYTRFVYPASMGYAQQYTTVVSGAGESYSDIHFDGVGRVRATSAVFPGSAGGYRAVHHMYDSMGRRVWTSNPTEINSGWVPSGDDAGGWVWTQQAYDWQGRPTLTTKPDGYTTEMTYGGCGCAGGEVVTIRDERGRRRKLYKDIFERLAKVEELNWDQSVYSTTTYSYNSRDQLTQMNHAGQIRTYEYDGYGRMAARTTPEQGRLTYAYNADDTVSVITDARGATRNHGYNGRHLLTSVTYGVPAGVAATPSVSYAYDAAGNRTQMSDGLGTVTYSYDSLSRLQWEERSFSGLAGAFRLSYAYNLAGQLTNVTNPWGSQVGYPRDYTGQATGVTGAGPVSFNTYAFNIAYRASGALKSMSYNNSRTLSISYDNLLRVKQWNVQNVLGWEYYYDYFNEHTGRATYARNLYDSTLDRSYDYDHVGRLTIAYTGMDARAHVGIPGSSWGVQDGPYASPNFYDVYGNITSRQGWGGANPWFSTSYTNNRRSGFTYDAAGNLLNDLGQNFTYDATGQQATASYSGYSLTNVYDGDRLRGKKTENGTITYYLRSTVLGGNVVAELNSSGGWMRGFVYDGGGQLLVLQHGGTVRYVHRDPVTKSQRITDTIGAVGAVIDLDPWGGETNRSQNNAIQPRKFNTYERDGNQSDDAMMRRYNRWHSRFDQPDPFDGSYDLTNPQTFNRYAYAENDPVNLVDPTGLCTFNINVTGGNNISAESRRAMEREITRIFNQAGHQVQFDNPTNADRTYNLTLTNSAPPARNATALGSTDVVGGTVQGVGRAFLGRIRNSLANDPDPGMRQLGRHNTNFGTAVGRVTAHEVGHYLLNLNGHVSQGLMRTQFGGDRSLFMGGGTYNGMFQFTAQQAQQLARLCQPPPAPTPTPNTPGPGGGLVGGGDIGGGFVGGGFSGYPSWWYSMWAFVDWVNSIPVGPRYEVTVFIYDVSVTEVAD